MADKLPTTDKGWQAYLQNIKPTGDRRYLALGDGLSVCITAAGDRQFQARLRRPGAANAARLVLGHFPNTSVADARRKLLDMRSAIKDGVDPVAERQKAVEAAAEVRTLRELIDRHLDRRAESVAEGKLRPKTLLLETQALDPIKSALGDRLLVDLTPKLLGDAVASEAKRLKEKGGNGRSANMALAAVKRVFKHAAGAGDYVAPSPAAVLSRPAVETPGDRILFDGRVLVDEDNEARNEIGPLVAALTDPGGRLTQETRTAIFLTLLMGLRVSEAASLQWSAVKLDGETPTLRIMRGKTAAAKRTLPLAWQAAEMLRALPRSDDYLFPARDKSRRAPHLHPESISRALTRIFDKLGIEEATEHDLRRTCLSGIVELTGDESLAERIAGHKGKSTLRIVYDQSKRLAAMLTALQAWADVVLP